MKKGLIFLTAIVSMLGINTVSADTTTITTYYDHFEEHIESYNTYKDNVNYLIDYWEENYSSSYPYYVVVSNLYDYSGNMGFDYDPSFILIACKHNHVIVSKGDNFILDVTSQSSIRISYSIDSNSYDFNGKNVTNDLLYVNYSDSVSDYNYMAPLLSNGLIYYDENYDFLVPTYISKNLGITVQEIQLKKGLNFPTLVNLYDGTYDYNIDEIPALELDDVFSNPLNTLKDLKDAIYNIFSIITEFILMLPPILQGTLITSFTIAIVLGIIKILL